jgi:hypothetical protein
MRGTPFRRIAVLAGVVASLAFGAAPTSQAWGGGCAADKALDTAISTAQARHELSPAQAARARCQPSLMSAPAHTTETTSSQVVSPSAVPKTATPIGPVAAPNYGTTVACTDSTKLIRSTNVFGMTLIWHATDTFWCWDRNFIITGGSSAQRDDSPGFCWGFDGETTPSSTGGTGWSFWDVTRGGKFSCHASVLAVFHRNLYASLNMSGGGYHY